MVNRYLLMIKLNFDLEVKALGSKRVLKKLKVMNLCIYALVQEIEKSLIMPVEKLKSY